MNNTDKQKLIEVLKVLLNVDDVEIIKCVIESLIEDLELTEVQEEDDNI